MSDLVKDECFIKYVRRERRQDGRDGEMNKEQWREEMKR